MNCPKCGHAQQDPIKCEACGIYFAKYHPQSKSPAGTPHRSAPDVGANSGLGLGAIVGTVLVTAVTVAYLMRSHDTPPANPAPRSASVAIRSNSAAPSNPLGRPAAHSDAPPAESLVGLAAKIAGAFPPNNSIEAARNATVLIKTGWSTGSGFILDEDCHVVTNRHVVDTDATRVANMVLDPDAQARIANSEQQLQQAIAGAQRVRHSWAAQPGRNLDVVKLDAQIQTMREKLAELSNLRQNIGDKVARSDHEGFSVTLVDGTEFTGLHAKIAGDVDLALVKLPADHCPHVVAGSSLSLSLGERLFTIGNPMGLTDSVTSGVFSGQQKLAGQRVLQTDAPINHGNSGGPLLTGNSQVVGINTMVMAGAHGIGFAIPIETVYQEFVELGRPALAAH